MNQDFYKALENTVNKIIKDEAIGAGFTEKQADFLVKMHNKIMQITGEGMDELAGRIKKV